MSNYRFVLVHSPLVGTYTWQNVAELLRALGNIVYVPDLQDSPDHPQPYWKQEVDSLDLSDDELILVGHSGAGALLPALSKKLKTKALIFVDAVLLFTLSTRLDLLQQESNAFATAFEAHLQNGGRFPEWTDEQLNTLIPDETIRKKLIADLRPRSLDFFTERIDVPDNWYHLPCGYIQLSDNYERYAKDAMARQWHVKRHLTNHFAMLTHPTKVAQLILEMTEQILP